MIYCPVRVKRGHFAVVRWSHGRSAMVGKDALGYRKTFRGALALCRKLGGRGEHVVVGSKHQVFLLESLFMY